MAALNAGSIAYSVKASRASEHGGPSAIYHNVVTLTVGDGVSTYPTGGIPITGNLLGLPQGQIEMCAILSQDGAPTSLPFPNIDIANNKLQFFVISTAGANVHMTEATNAYAPTQMILRCEVTGF